MTTALRRDCIILSAVMVIVFTRWDNDIIFMGNKKDVIISSCFVAIYIYIYTIYTISQYYIYIYISQ